MTFLVTMLPVRLAAIATTELPHRSRNGIERYLVFAAIASGDGDFRSGEAMSDASVGAALSIDEILEKIQRTIATDGQEGSQLADSITRPPRWPVLLRDAGVGDLANEIGKLCAEIADLEGLRKVFRDELIRRGVAEAEGALFRATVSEWRCGWTIDSAKVKAEMGAAWWDARCRQSLVTTVAVKARTGSTKLAA
jgi:hypothetical protein